jgi:hypothetical protein
MTMGLILSGLLGACQPAPPAPTPTAPPPSATSTVAFPTLVPTSTTTPGPSATPTPDLRSEMGDLLLADAFDDDAPWKLNQSDSGGSSLAGGRLSITVRRPRTYQLVTRLDASYTDILVEVDIHTELCSPGDEFGLMLRVNGLGEHYRFVIACDGTARASRVLEEGSRALTWPIANPAILPASPARNHLTVLARGDTFRFLINDVELLAVRDVSLASGGLGFIARAGSGGQVSVTFDDLAVYALKADPSATPTLAATPLP